MIDFGLADFRETFGAGYVAGKRGKLIHSEPHRAQPLYSLNARGIKEQPGGRYNTDGQLRQKAQCSSKFKFFPMPAGLLPEVKPHHLQALHARCRTGVASACAHLSVTASQKPSVIVQCTVRHPSALSHLHL